MTREEKLWTMRMVDLEKVADKLGIKINKKAAKEKAIAKILEAEGIHKDDWEEKANEEKEAREKLQEESDKAAENAVNKKMVPMPGTEGKSVEDHIKANPIEKKKPARGQLIEYNGKSQNICAWAKELGKSANTLYARIYTLGWDIEKAFTK